MPVQTDLASHKIMTMEAEKRQRVLNAAMEEFGKGFKPASTDEIVKRAGISKGLLFHYFGTKKELYEYLCVYAVETVAGMFEPVFGKQHRDPLERIWEMALLKRELCSRYPNIFEFLTAAYYQLKDAPESAFAIRYRQLQEEVYGVLYQEHDGTILREGIDQVMATNIIRWTMNGLAEQITREKKPFRQLSQEFDRYMEETRQYLELLRKMLYQDQH